MKYINKITQVVIDTACVIKSDKWELLKETKKSKTSEKPKRTPKTVKQGD